MIEKKVDSLTVLFFENLLGQQGVRHFVSTRGSGYSKPPYDSLNLGLHVGDDPDRVLRNRERLAEAIGIQINRFTIARQIHSGNVRIISGALLGSGSTEPANGIENTDAMVTDVPDICLIILVADCVPMLFFDPIKEAIGVAHAGWRGTLYCIAQNTVRAMETAFGSSPGDIIVGIGPSIGPCCYSVGTDVISRVDTTFHTTRGLIINKSDDGTGYLDLWSANLKQLLHAGIERKNIELARICTRENPDLFFSYRHQKGDTGRFGAGITLVSS